MINRSLMAYRVTNFWRMFVTRNSTLQGRKNLILSDMLFCRKPPKKGLNAEKPYFSVRLFSFPRNGRDSNHFDITLNNRYLWILFTNSHRLRHRITWGSLSCFKELLMIQIYKKGTELSVIFRKILKKHDCTSIYIYRNM